MDSIPKEEKLEENDSGMGPSKAASPEKNIDDPSLNADDLCEDEPDETLAERLWGLTEMFPEPVRNFSGAVGDFTVNSIKTLYKFSCNASWIFFTSSMILFAPVIFETERAQMEEMQKSQQKQMLLGPGAAGVTPGSGALPLPPMAR